MTGKGTTRSQRNDSAKHDSSRSAKDSPNTATEWQTPGALVQRARVEPGSLTAGNVLQLQRSVGNRAVNGLLQNSRGRTRTPVIQRKRARPEVDQPQDTYNANEPQYETAKVKGAGYLQSLQKRKDNLLPDEGKPMDIAEKNYEQAIAIGYEFETTMDEYEDEEEGTVVYDMLTIHRKDKDNFYHNNIVMPMGQIVADNNQPGSNKFPPSNSEVLWQQYAMALKDYKEKYAGQHGEADLTGISRQTITNPETNAVIWMVYDSDEEDEKSIDAASDDGKALLGTPNGKSSVWMLNDHLEELGNKSITSIDLEKDEGQNMTINIG